MNSEKYIGLDVHQATIVVAVMDSTGKLVIESILETEAATILQFFAGLRGNLSVTFEEGTWSAWLYDLLNPHVEKLVIVSHRVLLRYSPQRPGSQNESESEDFSSHLRVFRATRAMCRNQILFSAGCAHASH